MLELYVCLHVPPGTVLQQYGASPYFSHIMKVHLNHMMLDRWIGRGVAISWPPRSLDLTQLYFFLWGYIKNLVYQVKNNNVQQLKADIRDPMAMVILSMLQNTWAEVKYHLNICRATGCFYIEILHCKLGSWEFSFALLQLRLYNKNCHINFSFWTLVIRTPCKWVDKGWTDNYNNSVLFTSLYFNTDTTD